MAVNYEEILTALIEDYELKNKRDLNIMIPRKRIRSDNPTYKDAEDYAYRAGQLLSAALKEHLTADLFDDQSLSEEDVRNLIIPMLKENYSRVVTAAMEVQDKLNKSADLGLKPVKPAFNTEKAEGFIKAFESHDSFSKAAYLLGDPIVNNSQGIVEDCIKANADDHYKKGMSPTITRNAETGCCEWCNGLSGVYPYPGVPSDVWRRHLNCKCEVLYDPKNGKIQNSHTKEWIDTGAVKKRIEISFKAEEQIRNRPGSNISTIISSEINTKRYGNNFRLLGENDEVTGRMLREARNALYHRNGTLKEDLIYINTIDVRKTLVQKKYSKDSQVYPTESMTQMLLHNPSRSIIAIHNHPKSRLPSYDDLERAKYYKFGVIVCHNSDIFKYTVSDDANVGLANTLLDTMQRDMDDGKPLDMHLNALKTVGVDLEVIRI